MYQFATLLLLIQTKPRRQWTCDLHTEFSLTGWFACIIIHHNTCWFGALQRFGPETKQTHTKVEIILYIYLLYLLVIEWSSFNVKPHCPLFLYKNSPLSIYSLCLPSSLRCLKTERNRRALAPKCSRQSCCRQYFVWIKHVWSLYRALLFRDALCGAAECLE